MKHKIEIAPYSIRLYLLHNGFTSNLTSLAFCSSRQVTPIIAFLHDNPQMPYLLVHAESAVGREIVSAVSMQDTNFFDHGNGSFLRYIFLGLPCSRNSIEKVRKNLIELVHQVTLPEMNAITLLTWPFQHTTAWIIFSCFIERPWQPSGSQWRHHTTEHWRGASQVAMLCNALLRSNTPRKDPPGSGQRFVKRPKDSSTSTEHTERSFIETRFWWRATVMRSSSKSMANNSPTQLPIRIWTIFHLHSECQKQCFYVRCYWPSRLAPGRSFAFHHFMDRVSGV